MAGLNEHLRTIFQAAAVAEGSNQKFVVFEDKGFAASDVVYIPFHQHKLTTALWVPFDKLHKAVCIAIEWSFGKIKTIFPLLQHINTQCILLYKVGLWHHVSVLLTNAHSCCYGNQTSTYFNLRPLDLEAYFI